MRTLLRWIGGALASSAVILAVSIILGRVLQHFLSGDTAAWTESVGAIFAIVAGFATALYQLKRQQIEASESLNTLAQAAHQLAFHAVETVSERLDAALTPRSRSKRYSLRGERAAEMVAAMRELDASALPPVLLADFVTLRSFVSAINTRLTDVYRAKDRLTGADYQARKAGRAERLTSARVARDGAVGIFVRLQQTATASFGATELPFTSWPMLADTTGVEQPEIPVTRS